MQIIESSYNRSSTINYPYSFTYKESTGWWSVRVHNRASNTWFISVSYVMHKYSYVGRFSFLIHLKLNVSTLTYDFFEIHTTSYFGKLCVPMNSIQGVFFTASNT